MQILNNIYQVGGSLNGITWTGTDANYDDCNTYLLKTEQGIIMFDCGCGDTLNQIFNNMELWGLDSADIKACFITHPHLDHAGGAYMLEEYGIPLYAHKNTVDAIKGGDERCCGYLYHKTFHSCKTAISLEDDQVINICDVEILTMHLPGHSAGCTAYIFEHDGKKIVVSGDIIGTLLDGYFGWDGSFDFNKQTYLKSLQRFARLDSDIMLPGHGMVYFYKPRRRIEEAFNQALIEWR